MVRKDIKLKNLRKNAPVAQWLARMPSEHTVMGSNPIRGVFILILQFLKNKIYFLNILKMFLLLFFILYPLSLSITILYVIFKFIQRLNTINESTEYQYPEPTIIDLNENVENVEIDIISDDEQGL